MKTEKRATQIRERMSSHRWRTSVCLSLSVLISCLLVKKLGLIRADELHTLKRKHTHADEGRRLLSRTLQQTARTARIHMPDTHACTCTHAYHTHIHIHSQTHSHAWHTRIHIHSQTHSHAHTHTHMYTGMTHTCIAHTFTCTHGWSVKSSTDRIISAQKKTKFSKKEGKTEKLSRIPEQQTDAWDRSVEANRREGRRMSGAIQEVTSDLQSATLAGIQTLNT